MVADILGWCKSIVAITPMRWLSLVDSTPLELLLKTPAPGEWSALQCLQHLVEVERSAYPTRIKALLAGDPFPGFNPNANGAGHQPTAALATEFNLLRSENLKLLNQVTEVDLERRALHAEYGMVSMREFLHHWAAHDLMHTVQGERALMQPFIQGCGPWQINYTDHTVKVSD